MDDTKNIIITDYLKKELPEVDENEQEEFLLSMGIAKEKDNFKLEHNQFSKFAFDYIQVVLKGNQKELSIYNFKKGVYENEYVEETLGKIIKYLLNYITDLWNPSWEDLIIKTLKRDTHTVVNNFNNGEFLNLKDGVLDLETFELKEHSPQYYSTIQLPIEFKKNAKTTVFNKFLDDITCSDEELITILQEIVGYCLCNSTKAEKAFFFIGNGCNGKSVLAKVIQLLVGESNYSNTPLSALSGNFGLASLINSNVNIAAENNNGKLNSEIFKAVVSGDTVEINRKYRDAISVPLHTKLIFLFNELPDNGDLTHGFFRKIIIVPFNRTFKGAEIDVDMYSKLEKEISGIFQWAIDGLKRLKENDYKFSSCSASDKCLEDYKRELNPVAEFFDTHFKLNSNQQIKRSEIYNRYQEYCYKNSYETLQCQKFWKLLKAHWSDRGYNFTLKKIKGYEHFVGFNFN